MNSRKCLLELLALQEIDLSSPFAILVATVPVVMATVRGITVDRFVGMAVESKPANKKMVVRVGFTSMVPAAEPLEHGKGGTETMRTHNNTHM